jgi:hypothetical protein
MPLIATPEQVLAVFGPRGVVSPINFDSDGTWRDFLDVRESLRKMGLIEIAPGGLLRLTPKGAEALARGCV